MIKSPKPTANSAKLWTAEACFRSRLWRLADGTGLFPHLTLRFMKANEVISDEDTLTPRRQASQS